MIVMVMKQSQVTIGARIWPLHAQIDRNILLRKWWWTLIMMVGRRREKGVIEVSFFRFHSFNRLPIVRKVVVGR